MVIQYFLLTKQFNILFAVFNAVADFTTSIFQGKHQPSVSVSMIPPLLLNDHHKVLWALRGKCYRFIFSLFEETFIFMWFLIYFPFSLLGEVENDMYFTLGSCCDFYHPIFFTSVEIIFILLDWLNQVEITVNPYRAWCWIPTMVPVFFLWINFLLHTSCEGRCYHCPCFSR